MTGMIEKVTTWAQDRPEIRLMLLVGSRARHERPGDEWADYDFELFVSSLPVDSESQAWADPFGRIAVYIHTLMDGGIPHPLILFADGVKVDVAFEPLANLEQIITNQRLYDSQQRGYNVLLDRDGWASRLPAPAQPVAVPPTEAAFLRSVDYFWFGAAYVAKQIRRRNLWVVKFRDAGMKEELLKMLEWTAASTWHGGDFLPEWIAPKLLAQAPDTFGGWSAEESWRALLASMRLFEEVSRAVAKRHDFDFPEQLTHDIGTYVRALRDGDA